MDSRIFKKTFGQMAVEQGFESEFGGWTKESNECILVLSLQKSNYSPSYYLNIKIYIHGLVKEKHVKNKELIMDLPGNFFRRQPKQFDAAFDLESPLSDHDRIRELEELFTQFLIPFSELALTKEGIRQLWKKDELFLTATDKAFLDLI